MNATYEYVLSLDELFAPNALFAAIDSFRDSGGHVVILCGMLASGKTTLVQAYAAQHGISNVSSPTFSLAQCYAEDLWHYDLYRYTTEQALALGILDLISIEGLHFVEWGENLGEICRKLGIMPLLNIEIMEAAANRRKYRISICTC